MKYTILGKTVDPVILILPGKAIEPDILIEKLSRLSKKYCLAVASFDTKEETPEIELKKWTDAFFPNGVWGAYGLCDGGKILLSSCFNHNVRIKTIITEDVADCPTLNLETRNADRIELWYAQKDRKSKQFAKKMREKLPYSYSLVFKKRKEGDLFILIRPDLMIKRMKASYGLPPKDSLIVKITRIFTSR